MSRIRLILALLCALLLAVPAGAAPTTALRFKRQNLSVYVSTLALLQDRQGFVWIGTQSGGLLRYDGYHLVRYGQKPNTPNSLPNNRVYALYQDGQGRIWAGTRGGLARYNPESNDFTHFQPGPGPDNRLEVRGIIGDGKDGLWLATWGGLEHVNTASGKIVQYLHSKDDAASLATNDVNALAMDDHGGLWVATWPGGLDYLPAGAKAFQHFQVALAGAAASERSNIVRALYFDRRHKLWIGTEAGILTWQQGADWSERHRVDAPIARINYFYADANENLWTGTLSAGLWRFDPGSEHAQTYSYRANDPYSIPGDNVRAIMRDGSGMLWVGTFTDGIALANLNSLGFSRIVPYDLVADGQQASYQMLSIQGDGHGRLWLGSNGGLRLFDPVSGVALHTYSAAPGKAGALASNLVYSLYHEPGGRLWAGTDGGLHRLDRPDGPFQVYHLGNKARDHINGIAPGLGDVLWLATGDGVVRFDRKTGATRAYVHDDADPSSRAVGDATTILEDRQGRVWVGSEDKGGGLDLLDPASGRFSHFRHAPGQAGTLDDDHVTTLFEDANGRLFAGTSAGVNQVFAGADGDVHFRSYVSADAVGAVRTLAMRTDKRGRLWMSTVSGLVCLDPNSGRAERYASADDMNDAFTVGAAYADEDGNLYFGGSSRSMTRVQPDVVRIISTPPRVAITDVRVFNHSLTEGAPEPGIRLDGPVSAPRGLVLDAQHPEFSLEFAALHFADPLRNHYRHRLIGFDSDWVETDAEHRSATYTNLDPGTYVFKIKASNNRGLWSEQEVSLPVTILPPYWKTWWFRLAAAVLVLALLAAAYRLRVGQLRRQRVTLKALVAARTRALEESNRQLGESNAKLAALSATDGLTGIANRRAFDEALAREWGRAARGGASLALAMLDVDHFKRYNDHYGHQEGDACLQAVAAEVRAHGRRSADLAARYGGEEFVLLLPAADAKQALALARELCAAVAALALPHAASPCAVVTVSVGVAALVPSADMAPRELIEQADQALYRAKQAGRNRAELGGAAETA